MRKPTLMLAAVATLVLAGCAVPGPPGPNPYPPPPAILVETIPPPPVSGDPQIWQPGHWDWTGSSYAWSQGLWVSRAAHGSVWQQGYWTPVNGVWTWVPAHWA
ncbi:MAG: YXWGXW repeat-containing protein [Acidisphaera sp.]|nr:YXWGXW repeat-containing protein [Acidisphaera sp.]